MNHLPKTAVAATLLALAAALAPAATAVAPTSVSVADEAGDQTHGDVWNKYPAQRPAADLRRAVFAVEDARRTLRLTLTFAASPTLSRVYQTAGMSTKLGGKQVTFYASRRDNGTTTTGAFSSTDDGSVVSYCKGKMTVAINKDTHRLTMRVPISCLPAGRVLDNPYPTSYLTALKPGSELIEGTIGSDPQYAAPDLTIR